MSLPTPYYEDKASGITIYCADNKDVLPYLPACDLLLTDPPYGIGFAAQPTDYQRLNGMKASKWDDSPACPETIQASRQLCFYQIIWGGNYFALSPSRCWLSWYKPDAPPSMGNVEYAWTNLDRNSRMIHRSIAATNPERVGHPTQKPLEVIRWCINQAPVTRTILDPWLGSGTTLRAAKDLGRKGIGIEINEDYCRIAVERLRQEVLITV